MSQMLLYIDAESLISHGGIFLVCLVMFCSVGLFFCFFLPIGGILFTVGILTATGDLVYSIFTICFLLILSSIAGSLAGWAIGRSTGNFFYTRKDSRFFRRKYLIATEEFFKKYGAVALIAGLFLTHHPHICTGTGRHYGDEISPFFDLYHCRIGDLYIGLCDDRDT